jgi:hypothetical protein
MGKPQFAILSATCSLPESDCVITKTPEGTSQSTYVAASIDLRCRLPFGTGSKEYVLRVRSNDKNIPSRQVDVAAVAHTPLRVEPSLLRLSQGDRVPVVGRIIGNARIVRLLDAKTDSPLIDAVIEYSDRSSGSDDIGRLVVKPKDAVKPARGVAIVTLRYRVDPAAESLELTVPVAIETKK